MRPLKTLSLLSLSPLYCSACRNSLFLTQQVLRSQCVALPSNVIGSPKRLSSTSAVGSNFVYRIGASYSAKGRRFKPQEDTFSFDTTKSSESYTGRPNSGQDAFFVSETGPTSKFGRREKVAFGVADGVGGWADSGIDSADFSHGLCQSMAAIAKDAAATETSNDPQQLIEHAYEKIVNEEVIAGGGSTACVAIGDQNGSLLVANLGDSGFIHFRLNAVHYFSNPQTHAFNTPFQLSIVPPKVLALSKMFGGKQLSDSPRDSNFTDHQVRHGDVLVFATDGVWDNLSTVDLLKIVSQQMLGFQAWSIGENGTTVTQQLNDLTTAGGIAKGTTDNSLQTVLAVNIVGEAKQASLDTKRDGPFAKEVHKFYPQEDYHGGKIDDICVVVAVAVDSKKV
ncbi:Protein phosphatase 2C 7 [Lecanora helva]